MEQTCQQYLPIGPLAFLDVAWRHVHWMVKESTASSPAVSSSVWDPQGILLPDEFEKVQKRAARFVTGNYTYETGSMTGILEQI